MVMQPAHTIFFPQRCNYFFLLLPPFNQSPNNKLIIHFGKGNTKWRTLSSKIKLTRTGKISIVPNGKKTLLQSSIFGFFT